MRCPNSRGKYNPLSSLPPALHGEHGMDLRAKVPSSEKNEQRNKAQPCTVPCKERGGGGGGVRKGVAMDGGETERRVQERCCEPCK